MYPPEAPSLFGSQPKSEPFALAQPGRAAWIDPAAMTEALLDDAARMIDDAHCPLLCLGDQIALAGGSAAAVTFAERVGLPTATTPMALGAMPSEHPLWVGQLEMPASRFTKMVLQEADLLLVVGAFLDDGSIDRAAEYCPAASRVRLDRHLTDKPADLALSGDLSRTLGGLLSRLTLRRRGKWLVRVDGLRRALS